VDFPKFKEILDRGGNPPSANESGWKDTTLVYQGEKVRAIASFKNPVVFRYHYHILPT
jgi:blue copper oxidase